MKWYQVWKLEFKDMKGVPVPCLWAYPRRRIWISVAAVFVITTVLWAYLYPPQDYTNPVRDWFPSEPTRELTDQETAARVVFRQILSTPPFISRNPKIAFMFLTPGLLPFDRLWELFFKGCEGRYTIYVHASREKPEHVSPIFVGRDIHSEKVIPLWMEHCCTYNADALMRSYDGMMLIITSNVPNWAHLSSFKEISILTYDLAPY